MGESRARSRFDRTKSSVRRRGYLIDVSIPSAPMDRARTNRLSLMQPAVLRCAVPYFGRALRIAGLQNRSKQCIALPRECLESGPGSRAWSRRSRLPYVCRDFWHREVQRDRGPGGPDEPGSPPRLSESAGPQPCARGVFISRRESAHRRRVGARSGSVQRPYTYSESEAHPNPSCSSRVRERRPGIDQRRREDRPRLRGSISVSPATDQEVTPDSFSERPRGVAWIERAVVVSRFAVGVGSIHLDEVVSLLE